MIIKDEIKKVIDNFEARAEESRTLSKDYHRQGNFENSVMFDVQGRTYDYCAAVLKQVIE